MGRKKVIEMPNLRARIDLIRHRETEWSLSGRHTSRTDIPLTGRGEDGAQELGQRLRDIEFVHVRASPRQRARRTCDLAGLGKAAEIEPDLAEWDYGDHEGQRPADIRTGRTDWSLCRDGCPRGETPAQISDRVDRLIGRLRVRLSSRVGARRAFRRDLQLFRRSYQRRVRLVVPIVVESFEVDLVIAA